MSKRKIPLGLTAEKMFQLRISELEDTATKLPKIKHLEKIKTEKINSIQ